MKIIGLFIGVLLHTANILPALAIDTKGWGEAALNAVVRIRAVTCPHIDCKVINPKEKTATGFLYRNANGNVGILTALHAVAGTTKQYYQFTALNKFEIETKIIAIDTENDLALLAIDADGYDIAPLENNGKNIENLESILVIGHTNGAPTPLASIGNVRPINGMTTLEELLRVDYRIELNNIGFPSTKTKVYSIQNILQPGDSGAPIFSLNGDLLAVANGGLPDSNGVISWAIPIEATANLVDVSTPKLFSLSPKTVSSITSSLSYSSQIDRVYNAEKSFRNEKIYVKPQLDIVLRLDMKQGALSNYRDILKKSDYYYNTDTSKPFGSVPIEYASDYFPGKEKAIDNDDIITLLQNIKFELECFGFADFRLITTTPGIIDEKEPLLQLSIQFDDVRNWLKNNNMKLSSSEIFNSHLLNLYTTDSIVINGAASYMKIKKKNNKMYQLLGGACRLNLDGEKDNKSQMELALELGISLIRLHLSDYLVFDLWNASLLPRLDGSNRSDLWALFPVVVNSSGEDQNGIFK